MTVIGSVNRPPAGALVLAIFVSAGAIDANAQRPLSTLAQRIVDRFEASGTAWAFDRRAQSLQGQSEGTLRWRRDGELLKLSYYIWPSLADAEAGVEVLRMRTLSGTVPMPEVEYDATRSGNGADTQFRRGRVVAQIGGVRDLELLRRLMDICVDEIDRVPDLMADPTN
jgi:hypothetical protein